MNLAPVASDHQLAVLPLGIFVSADQEFEGELFEDVIVSCLEIVAGKGAENGAWFGDVLARSSSARLVSKHSIGNRF
jgi:hypothetical protein